MSRFILAVLSVLMAVTLSYAQGPGMMGDDPEMDTGMMGRDMMSEGMMGEGHMFLRNLAGLGLNEKQKDTIMAIKTKMMKDVIRKRADMRIDQIDLRELLHQDKVDMKAVEGKLKQIEALKTDIRLARIKGHEEIKATLTPDQRKKFMEMTEKRYMMRGMKGMHGGCGMMQRRGMGQGMPPAEGGDMSGMEQP